MLRFNNINIAFNINNLAFENGAIFEGDVLDMDIARRCLRKGCLRDCSEQEEEDDKGGSSH